MDCSPQAALPMEFFRQEYWRGLPCTPPGDLSDPGFQPISPAAAILQADSLPLSHRGSSDGLYVSLKSNSWFILIINKFPSVYDLHLVRDVFRFKSTLQAYWGFPDCSSSKESAHNVGDRGDASSIPESGRSPGGGNCNLLQYSCWENPMDRGPWRVAVPEVSKTWTQP